MVRETDEGLLEYPIIITLSSHALVVNWPEGSAELKTHSQ